jgi:hypothetical protein
MNPDTQKSEVHETTDDADTSPANLSPQELGTLQPDAAPDKPKDHDPAAAFPPGTKVNRDDSDAGGPIDIEIDTRE